MLDASAEVVIDDLVSSNIDTPKDPFDPSFNRYNVEKEQWRLGVLIKRYGPDSSIGRTAVDELVRTNKDLAYHLLNKRGIPRKQGNYAQAESNAMFALLNAARNYDPRKGKFSTHYRHQLRSLNQHTLFEEISDVKFGTTQWQRDLYYGLKSIAGGKHESIDRDATDEEVAGYYGCTTKQIHEVRQRVRGDKFLDRKLRKGGRLRDLIPDSKPGTEERLDPTATEAGTRWLLDRMIDTANLNPKYATILRGCYLFDPPQTHGELADLYGCSASNIGAIKDRAIKELRAYAQRKFR